MSIHPLVIHKRGKNNSEEAVTYLESYLKDTPLYFTTITQGNNNVVLTTTDYPVSPSSFSFYTELLLEVDNIILCASPSPVTTFGTTLDTKGVYVGDPSVGKHILGVIHNILISNPYLLYTPSFRLLAEKALGSDANLFVTLDKDGMFFRLGYSSSPYQINNKDLFVSDTSFMLDSVVIPFSSYLPPTEQELKESHAKASKAYEHQKEMLNEIDDVAIRFLTPSLFDLDQVDYFVKNNSPARVTMLIDALIKRAGVSFDTTRSYT